MEETRFEVKNGAYSPGIVNEQTVRKIRDFFLSSSEEPLPDEVYAQVMRLDLSHYYMDEGKGAKVTKLIKKILVRAIGKEKVDPVFPAFCKEISGLYTPKMEIRAFWGPKELLGNGQWEGHDTCFIDGGCNETSRIFLEKFRRTKALVLEHGGEDAMLYARCIAFFAGGRNIYLSNFYFKGLPNNKLLFVEALRRLVGLPAIKYASAELPLPIYKNGDGIKCYDGRSGKHKGRILYPCPHCDKKVPKLVSFESGNTFYIGCSNECADENKQKCPHCEEWINENDSYTAPGGQSYCESCHEDLMAYCDACGSTVWRDDYLGNDLCTECGFVCNHCGEAYRNNDSREGADGSDYCESCFSKKYVVCEECNDTVEWEEFKESEDGGTYCLDCYNSKYTVCKECERKVEESEAEDGLCEACHEAREEEADENATINA